MTDVKENSYAATNTILDSPYLNISQLNAMYYLTEQAFSPTYQAYSFLFLLNL